MGWPHWETIAREASGIVGALVSLRYVPGSWSERLTMAFGGAAFAYFASDFVAERTSIPEGLTGFLLGLFGMSILSKTWEWLQDASIDQFLSRWLPGYRSAPPPEPPAPPKSDRRKTTRPDPPKE